jgi:membrane associated rhomboid family serine protease
MIWLLPWDEDATIKHVPWVTWGLIALNLLAFIVMLAATPTEQDGWYLHWGLVPVEPHALQFLTSSFVHAGVAHLFFNMLFLLVFGDNVEDAFGPLPFLALYFLGGLAGETVMVLANPTMAIPSVGASGCISTLAGAYLVLFFGSRVGVRLMFLVLTVKVFHLRAIWVMLLWFGADLYHTFASHGVLPDGGGTNFVAHGMGFFVGLLAGFVALLCGVLRRYELLTSGHGLLGYWPTSLEETWRRRPVRRK